MIAPTKILVVDDSALYRQSLHNILREIESVEVVGSACNGLEALEKISTTDPDLLTLDVEMPDMDGIALLREIAARRLRPKAIMVSSFTAAGAQVTLDALLEGAFDFILKPSGADLQGNRSQLQDALAARIAAFRELLSRQPKHWLRHPPQAPAHSPSGWQAPTSPATGPPSQCRAVVLGTSTGGPAALKFVLPKLPSDLPAPVFVVQHMPAKYTASLAKRLNESSPLRVVEAQDRDEATPGTVWIAPGGKQMKLRQMPGGGLQVRVLDDPPDNGVRPSIDYLLASVTEELGGTALAVIMTGMGRDGLAGSRQLKACGGTVFAQHPDDCVVYGMPKVVIEENLADRVLPLGKIGPAIVRHLKRQRRGS